MITIHKYPLNPIVAMPQGAHILKTDGNHLWALVDTQNTPVVRHFEVIGTGWEFNPTNKVYIDTFFEGTFVWHIWERT